ncbi:DUF4251 domain-containing protein [Sediminibacterium soli]|uniref:DUF4251 domain-containing protein n=1 Tax=Sediminibacterium soli TaxID=2698829 RepID=UPI00137ABCBA|nr:DUF4251 domain-containing protein [Sediminibacterium soli]NCI47022.1 DUF4251 domain-containing protein [Sediminibacterium soli]
MKPVALILAAVLLFTGIHPAAAQHPDEPTVSQKIGRKQFVFVAQTVLPLRSMVRQISGLYELRISGDSVLADLPYFGRAYSAPMDMTGGGIRFTSVKNAYTVKNRKKGGWDIAIRINEPNDVRELNLSVFPNGTASLRVTSTNRDPISFNGFIATGR